MKANKSMPRNVRGFSYYTWYARWGAWGSMGYNLRLRWLPSPGRCLQVEGQRDCCSQKRATSCQFQAWEALPHHTLYRSRQDFHGCFRH